MNANAERYALCETPIACDRHGTAYPVPEAVAFDASVSSVDLLSLAPGSEVVVETRNSRYHLVVVDGRHAHVLVHGGKHFGEVTPARLDGSISGGILLHPHSITVGMSMAFTTGVCGTVTSPVRAFRFEPLRG